MFRYQLLVALIPAFLWAQSAFGQCCAAGNPISADGSPGGTGKNILELSLYYQHSYSDTYYDGDSRTDYRYIDYSLYDYGSFRASYGILNRLKVRAEMGYFFSKAQAFTFGYDRKAYGFSDLVVGVQYNMYRNQALMLDIFPTFDITFPVGRFDQMSGPVVLPIDIQPGSGSFKYNFGLLSSKRFLAGKVAVFLMGSAEISQRINTDRTHYKYGNLYNVSLYGSYTFFGHLTAAVQVRAMVRDRASDADKEKINATGGTYVFLSPQVRYTFFRNWSLGLLLDYPVYKYVNGKQLTNRYAFSCRLTRTIHFAKKNKVTGFGD